MVSYSTRRGSLHPHVFLRRILPRSFTLPPRFQAVFRPPPPPLLQIQTLDFFRIFFPRFDPYVFGQIAGRVDARPFPRAIRLSFIFLSKSPCLFAFDKIDGAEFGYGSSTCLFSQCSCPFLHRTTIHCTLSLPRDPFPLFSYPHALSILPSFHTCRSQPRPL